MYQFKENCNHNQFFWWSKRLIKNMNWALLPSASKAVFPVIACHCNENGEAFPGERTIGILAGRTDKKVRKGIKGLEDFPNFKMTYYTTKRGRRSKKFYIKLPSGNVNGRSFPFYRFILESGMWRELRPSAQALYPVMRYFGFFDLDTYEEFEGDSFAHNEFSEIYQDRECDYCQADKYLMAELAGINRRSMPEALNDLQRNFLIEPANGGWKVFLKTKDYNVWKRDYLNKKVIKAYRHEMQS